jgi:Gas vesicle synthesis protein GvpL/GvpF
MTTEQAQSVTLLYLYGIVSAEAPLPAGLAGIQGQPVETVTSGDLAAVVSTVEDVDTLGLPPDLLAHGEVLDRLAAETAVLPVTFGTTIPEDELTDDLLPSMQDAYTAALQRVGGAAQFVVRAGYVQDVVLSELVGEDREIARLRETTAGTDPEESHFDLIRLGQLVVEGLERKARADASRILDALRPLAADHRVREGGPPDQVLAVALLVERGAEGAVEAAVQELASQDSGRIQYRLLGPQAPYDFVDEDGD